MSLATWVSSKALQSRPHITSPVMLHRPLCPLYSNTSPHRLTSGKPYNLSLCHALKTSGVMNCHLPQPQR